MDVVGADGVAYGVVPDVFADSLQEVRVAEGGFEYLVGPCDAPVAGRYGERSESATPRTGSMSIPSDRVPVGSIRNVRRLHGQRDGCPTRRHRRRFPGLPFARSVRVAFSRSTRKECSIWSGSSRAGHSLTI